MEQHVSGSLQQQQHMNMRLSRTNIFFSVFHCLLLLLLLLWIQENIYRRGIRKNKRTNKFQPIFFRLHFSSSHIYALSATAAGYCCLMVLCSVYEDDVWSGLLVCVYGRRFSRRPATLFNLVFLHIPLKLQRVQSTANPCAPVLWISDVPHGRNCHSLRCHTI